MLTQSHAIVMTSLASDKDTGAVAASRLTVDDERISVPVASAFERVDCFAFSNVFTSVFVYPSLVKVTISFASEMASVESPARANLRTVAVFSNAVPVPAAFDNWSCF